MMKLAFYGKGGIGKTTQREKCGMPAQRKEDTDRKQKNSSEQNFDSDTDSVYNPFLQQFLCNKAKNLLHQK